LTTKYIPSSCWEVNKCLWAINFSNNFILCKQT
jgi:hypothetical protein